MSGLPARTAAFLGLSILVAQAAHASRETSHDAVEVRAYLNEACVVADEPFFVPAAAGEDAGETPKFLPLIGLVVGKLTELFINHEIEGSAERIKAGGARKDTRYAVRRQMNLYRATFDPAPEIGLNAQLGCMTIVAAGSFKPDPADCKAEYHPKELARESLGKPRDEWKTSRSDDSIENQLKRANICLAGKARAVYESRFEFSQDGTAFRLKDAGYHVESLLTTPDKNASRTTVYSLKVSDPGATDQQEVLASAWVDVGTVKAGAQSAGGSGNPDLWWRVPPLSADARRKYDADTRVHQEAIGELEALRRAHTRNQRIMAGLDQRIAAAGPDIAEGLRQERLRIAVQDQSQAAEIEARTAEYRDLPRTPLEFMPVSIEVAVTESESEDKARLALADVIGKTGGAVASALGGAATGALSKSLSAPGLQGEPDSAPGSDIDRARDRYFDALVDARSHAGEAGRDDSQRRLAAAREDYNQKRRTLGLEPIK